MKNKILVSVAVASLFLSSCKKPFSVNAPYEDFPIVIGLLNASEQTHYIKVYKSFVTEHNAYDAAKDIDLYSYIDSIDVYVEERNASNVLVRTIRFDTTTEIPKNQGVFAYPTQIIYKADAVLNENYKYKLFVYNRYTKKMATSKEVLLAGNVNVRRPSASQVFPVITINDNALPIEYFSAKNTSLYDFTITYYYSEQLNDNSLRQGNPIVWYMGEQTHQTTTSGLLSFSVGSGTPFYQKIASGIIEDENVIARRTDSIVLTVSTAARDWYLYLLASRPSSGLNQNRLDYSNISAYDVDNGKVKYAMGIFSSRNNTMKMFRDLAEPASRDSLFHGRFTGHLKFTDIY